MILTFRVRLGPVQLRDR